MRIYYIDKIINDTCYLETPSKIYSEVVDISELKVYAKSNCIVGFNKVTGGVKVSTKEDVFNFVNSKLKLAGLNKVVLMYDDNCGKISQLSYDETNNILEITIDDKWSGFDLNCLYDSVVLVWKDIRRDIINYIEAEKIKPMIAITLNICSYKRIYGMNYNPQYLYSGNDVEISDSGFCVTKVNIANKGMFKETLSIKELFLLNTFTVKDYAIDLTDLEFNPEVHIKSLLSSYNLPLVELPEILYRNLDEPYRLFEVLRDNLIHSELKALIMYGLKNWKIAQGTLYSPYSSRARYVDEIRYSDLVKLYEELPESGKNAPKETRVKLYVNNFILDTPVDFNDKITPLRYGLLDIRVDDKIIIEDSFDISLDYNSIMITVNMVDSMISRTRNLTRSKTEYSLKENMGTIVRQGSGKLKRTEVITFKMKQFREEVANTEIYKQTIDMFNHLSMASRFIVFVSSDDIKVKMMCMLVHIGDPIKKIKWVKG